MAGSCRRRCALLACSSRAAGGSSAALRRLGRSSGGAGSSSSFSSSRRLGAQLLLCRRPLAARRGALRDRLCPRRDAASGAVGVRPGASSPPPLRRAALYAIWLIPSTAGVRSWLVPSLLVLAVLAELALVVAGRLAARTGRASVAALALALVAVLLAPGAAAVSAVAGGSAPSTTPSSRTPSARRWRSSPGRVFRAGARPRLLQSLRKAELGGAHRDLSPRRAADPRDREGVPPHWRLPRRRRGAEPHRDQEPHPPRTRSASSSRR